MLPVFSDNHRPETLRSLVFWSALNILQHPLCTCKYIFSYTHTSSLLHHSWTASFCVQTKQLNIYFHVYSTPLPHYRQKHGSVERGIMIGWAQTQKALYFTVLSKQTHWVWYRSLPVVSGGKLKRLLITYSPSQTLKRNEDSAVFSRRKRKNIVVNKTGFLKSCESLQPQEVLQHTVMKVPNKY